MRVFLCIHVSLYRDEMGYAKSHALYSKNYVCVDYFLVESICMCSLNLSTSVVIQLSSNDR